MLAIMIGLPIAIYGVYMMINKKPVRGVDEDGKQVELPVWSKIILGLITLFMGISLIFIGIYLELRS